jgi:hypothetical protein
MVLIDADQLLTPAVKLAVEALDIDDSERPLATLALRYAKVLDSDPDDAELLRSFGPKLKAVLDVLGIGATAATRARMRGTFTSDAGAGDGRSGGGGVSPLHRMREAHQERRYAS